MLSADASSYLILAGVAIAIWLLLRRKSASEPVSVPSRSRPSSSSNRPDHDSEAGDTTEMPFKMLRWQLEMHETAARFKGELDSKLSALQALVLMAKREAERLETAIVKAESLELAAPRDTLAQMDRLAEPAAMESENSLAAVAASLPRHHSDECADPFADEQKVLAIARLSEQGNSPPQIARRLGLPLGEVEFLLSLRSA
jgi:hypothetical protein